MTIEQAEIKEAMTVAWLRFKAELVAEQGEAADAETEAEFRHTFSRGFLAGCNFGADELFRRWEQSRRPI